MSNFTKNPKSVILRENPSIDITSLAAETAVKAAANLNLQQGFQMLKMKIYGVLDVASIDDVVMLGICYDDLSVAEIEECIELAGPTHAGLVTEGERTMRKVFPLIVMGGEAINQRAINDGNNRPLEIKFRWTFSEDVQWSWFAYNVTSGVFNADTSLNNLFVEYYGVWLD